MALSRNLLLFWAIPQLRASNSRQICIGAGRLLCRLSLSLSFDCCVAPLTPHSFRPSLVLGDGAPRLEPELSVPARR